MLLSEALVLLQERYGRSWTCLRASIAHGVPGIAGLRKSSGAGKAYLGGGLAILSRVIATSSLGVLLASDLLQ